MAYPRDYNDGSSGGLKGIEIAAKVGHVTRTDLKSGDGRLSLTNRSNRTADHT